MSTNSLYNLSCLSSNVSGALLPELELELAVLLFMRLLMLAHLRAQGFSKHLIIPMTKIKIAAWNNLLSPDHDLWNT
jgi:hypothetical protein